jgi:hypothetical protein
MFKSLKKTLQINYKNDQIPTIFFKFFLGVVLEHISVVWLVKAASPKHIGNGYFTSC